MKALILDKVTVEILNEMNQGNHKLSIVQLNDGSFVTPFKVLNEPHFYKYKKYLDKRNITNITKADIYKQVIQENGSTKI